MAVTDISIASRALLLLGEAPISNFGESSAAQTAAALYDGVFEAVLTVYPWGCTKSKARLARLAEPPVSQWAYAFALPTGVLRVLGAYPSAAVGAPALASYDLQETGLLANASDVWLDYQRRVAESALPPYVVKLLQLALAAELAMPITESTTKAEYWSRQAWGQAGEGLKGGWYRLATSADAQGAPPAQIADFSLIDARA
jgi:hypothetical protein